MYIIELAAALRKKIKNKEFKFFKKKSDNPEIELENELEPQVCEHIFVPVDSTKKVLACTKCGFMVKVDTKN